jgi:hypothetical protein
VEEKREKEVAYSGKEEQKRTDEERFLRWTFR